MEREVQNHKGGFMGYMCESTSPKKEINVLSVVKKVKCSWCWMWKAEFGKELE